MSAYKTVPLDLRTLTEMEERQFRLLFFICRVPLDEAKRMIYEQRQRKIRKYRREREIAQKNKKKK